MSDDIEFEIEKERQLRLYGICYVLKKDDGSKEIIKPKKFSITTIKDYPVWGKSVLSNLVEEKP